MSKYAIKWREGTAEEYKNIYINGLQVYSTYTEDTEMITTWGDDDKELIKSYMTRTEEQAQDRTKWEWNYKYYIATEWED